MKRVATVDFVRRGLLTRSVPACAATYLALKGGTVEAFGNQGAGQAPGGPVEPAKHKFDAEFQGKLTYRQLFRMQFASGFIPLVRAMKKSLGRDKTLAVLDDMANDGVEQAAQQIVKQAGGNDLEAIKKMLGRLPANVWTIAVVRDTASVYELRVTECIWATTLREANLAEEGHAAVCRRDFPIAKAINPKIELTRDKTLMMGQDCCNHCYTARADAHD